MTSTAPQSLSGVFTVVTDEAFPAPPSIERQEEVLALWRRFCTSDPKHLSIFWWFIRAIDAQHAERTRAEVERMREAAAKVCDDDDQELAYGGQHDLWRAAQRALKEAAALIRAVSIEGTGQ